MATISKITGFSTTPATNDNLSDISLAEGWAPSTVNNAVRELMSFMADSANGAAGWNVIQTTGTAGTTQSQAGALAITAPSCGSASAPIQEKGNVFNTPLI